MKFFNQWVRPPKKPEKMDPLTITESRGYIPPHVQVENLLQAGRRLVEFRKEQYDFPPGEKPDESFEDPTRRPGYDLADASRDLLDVDARLRASAAAAAAKKEAEVTPSKDTAEPTKVDPGAKAGA